MPDLSKIVHVQRKGQTFITGHAHPECIPDTHHQVDIEMNDICEEDECDWCEKLGEPIGWC